MTEANGNGENLTAATTNGSLTEGGPKKEAAFTGTEYSPWKTFLAITVWLGMIHANVVLVLLALFVLPPRIALMVIAVQLVFMVVPVDRKSELGKKLARFVCRYACGYFPITLHLEDYNAFDPKQTYVFGYEPHSVLPIGICILSDNAGFMPLPKTLALASTAVFWTPFLRQIWTWMGLVPASRQSFYSNLARGNSCAVIPGGVQEMQYMDSTSEVAFLKARKGFVKVAIEMGSPLVPTFCFGQRHVYKWWRPEGKIFVKISRAIKFTPLVFWGRWGYRSFRPDQTSQFYLNAILILFIITNVSFFIFLICRTPIPYRVPMHVVVGTPIKVKQNPQPTYDEINEVHAQFLEAMEKLYEKYKGRFGYDELPLRIL